MSKMKFVTLIIFNISFLLITNIYAQEQLHVEGPVRFENLGDVGFYPQYLIGSDGQGVLSRFDSGLINAWKLDGNTTDGSQFLGTLNDQSLNIRTNNIDRVRVHSNGFVSIGNDVSSSSSILDLRYSNTTSYIPSLLGDGTWNDGNGLIIYNNDGGPTPDKFSSLIFANRAASNGHLSIAKINSIATGPSEAALSFQTETVNPLNSGDRILERMRITSTGKVEINLEDNFDNAVVLHTLGDIRMDMLPSGSGQLMVYNTTTNRIELSAATDFQNDDNSAKQITKKEVQELENRIEELEAMILRLAEEVSDLKEK